MGKKQFIALADKIRANNATGPVTAYFTYSQILVLADFCAAQNPAFDRSRWLGYIVGTNGPSGGALHIP